MWLYEWIPQLPVHVVWLADIVHSFIPIYSTALAALAPRKKEPRGSHADAIGHAMQYVNFSHCSHVVMILEAAPTPDFCITASSADLVLFRRFVRPPSHNTGGVLSSLSLARFARLLRNRSAHDLRPEEAALCPLDNLLVDALRRVVHDDCAGLVVDLGVDACVADQVDDPLLALVLRQAQACGEVPGDVSGILLENASLRSAFMSVTHLMSILWWILQ